MYPELQVKTPIGTLTINPLGRDRVRVARASERPLRNGAETYWVELARRADRWEINPLIAAKLPRDTVRTIAECVARWAAANDAVLDRAAIGEAMARSRWWQCHYLQTAVAEYARDLHKAVEDGAFRLPMGDLTEAISAEAAGLASISEQLASIEGRLLGVLGLSATPRRSAAQTATLSGRRAEAAGGSCSPRTTGRRRPSRLRRSL